MRLIDADKADVERIDCFYGGECRIADVREWLDEQPTVNPYEWISVEDKLPKDGIPVLVYKDKYSEAYGNMETAYIDKGRWRGSIGEAITHWMLLPTPPNN